MNLSLWYRNFPTIPKHFFYFFSCLNIFIYAQTFILLRIKILKITKDKVDCLFYVDTSYMHLILEICFNCVKKKKKRLSDFKLNVSFKSETDIWNDETWAWEFSLFFYFFRKMPQDFSIAVATFNLDSHWGRVEKRSHLSQCSFFHYLTPLSAISSLQEEIIFPNCSSDL